MSQYEYSTLTCWFYCCCYYCCYHYYYYYWPSTNWILDWQKLWQCILILNGDLPQICNHICTIYTNKPRKYKPISLIHMLYSNPSTNHMYITIKTFTDLNNIWAFGQLFPIIQRAPPWSSGSVLDHGSLPPESRRGHIWRLFHLWLRSIIFRGRSAHLAYLVHKSGRKTSTIIIPIIQMARCCCFAATFMHSGLNGQKTSKCKEVN